MRSEHAEMASSSTPVRVPWWCLASAVSAPLILGTSAGAAQKMRGPGYDPVTQTLSSLAAGGAGHWVMTGGFFAVALCTLITALGLRVVSVVARWALAGAGLCGVILAVFRGDLSGPLSVHLIAVVAGSAILVCWPLLTISPTLDRSVVRSARCAIAACAVLGMLALWMLLAANFEGRVGLAERAATITQFVWPAVIAIAADRHLFRWRAGAVTVDGER